MFVDRTDAALQLAEKLKHYKNTDSIVAAIPRGGVPIGRIVADALGLPLEMVLSKKISHPTQKEYAIGAVSLEGRILNDTIEVPEFYIEAETRRIRKMLQDRYDWYYKDRKPLHFQDKTVIVVDDGIATGLTMLSTLELLRQHWPSKIVVAVPISAPNAIKMLEASPAVNEVVCLSAPVDFHAVGQFYKNFEQVKDEEVIGWLATT